jgi:hypothetical protein
MQLLAVSFEGWTMGICAASMRPVSSVDRLKPFCEPHVGQWRGRADTLLLLKYKSLLALFSTQRRLQPGTMHHD